MKLPPPQLIKRVEKAMSRRDLWRNIWQDCYDFMLPNRIGFFQDIVGRDRTDKIFDDTAVNKIQDLAAEIVDGLAPPHSHFFRLKPGTIHANEDTDDLQDGLDEVTRYAHDVLRNSNFHTQIHETALDLIIGTGYLDVQATSDIKQVTFGAVPLTDYCIDAGPDGLVDGVFRLLAVSENDVHTQGFVANTALGNLHHFVHNSPALQPETGKQKNLIIACYRDWRNPAVNNYHYQIVDKDLRREIKYEELRGLGSKPAIISRWTAASGEIYGRGPALNVLPSTKSANLTQQLIFENAEMQIGGVWKAPMDGVVNYDNIVIEPGTVYPYNPSTRGLEGVDAPGNIQLSEMLLRQQQQNIIDGLYGEDFNQGGKTPISVAEVRMRQMRLARRMGSAVMRVFTELIEPAVVRTIYILRRNGQVVVPEINGRQVVVEATSPLAQAAQNAEIEATMGFTQAVNQVVGPAQAQLALNSEQIVGDLAKLFNRPAGYVTTPGQRRAIMESAGALQQLGGAGMSPSDVLPQT